MRFLYCIAALILLTTVSYARANVEFSCDNTQTGEFLISKTGKDFSASSNKATLFSIARELERKLKIEIDMPISRRDDAVTICIHNSSIVNILKSIFRENYALTTRRDGMVDSIFIAQKGTEESDYLPILSSFEGKIIIADGIARILHMPLSDSKEDIKNYISYRHSALEHLIATKPNETFSAQVSFKEPIRGEELLSILEGYNRHYLKYYFT
uniref:Uncharacterized protein n=1 Tax=Candidatus Kentrum sp. LPFa TaxID=2126335 RepID=A0A450X7W4_9GAMM|nr:MAG: hypothetical protein BECKLPF1236A_GA0070988_104691 [Candidatus Kentron sp. LPFa]VFK35941.1 MAG: hypothetical protein BECKLPF1236C_GA0070990_104511 [Candidatus Kentron sp. LPFa]